MGGVGLGPMKNQFAFVRSSGPQRALWGPFSWKWSHGGSNSVGGCGLVQLRYWAGWLRYPGPRGPFGALFLGNGLTALKLGGWVWLGPT